MFTTNAVKSGIWAENEFEGYKTNIKNSQQQITN